jgi:Family of unknown function (DUF6781)
LKAAWGAGAAAGYRLRVQTGAQAREVAETFTRNIKEQLQASRETAFKTAHALTQNYAAVVSGVLMGFAEAYQEKGTNKS